MSEKYVAKYIARSSAIASRMLGGEMMIMSAVDSTFFTLNPVPSVIWFGRSLREGLHTRGRSMVGRPSNKSTKGWRRESVFPLLLHKLASAQPARGLREVIY
jgi:hypothetical protein